MAFVDIQPAWDSVSVTTMLSEIKGGPCKFLKDPYVGSVSQDMPSLWPVCFSSQKCKGCEHKLHLYWGESFAGDWSLGKCHHYVWGMWNTWITGQYALVFLGNHDGNTGSICWLQMRIMMLV